MEISSAKVSAHKDVRKLIPRVVSFRCGPNYTAKAMGLRRFDIRRFSRRVLLSTLALID